MDINEIKKILPHRYPFLLIDRVEDLVAGERVVCKKNVAANEEFFNGHFPNEPVMPGVLMVEALAQAGAIVLLSLPEFQGKIVYLGGMDKVKFRSKIIPGDTLMLEVEILKLRNGAGIGKGIATVEGKKAVEAQLTFMIG
ncbi:MAG: 3-hydroxyacyl-ACP dehydratase FabZ [Streptococcaceae bacterium]|jgi:3-hydroxyacyl-[acyl-carrier-protein] dehydratase|nr:3-hydroxyacyl-ACP dehydratase FabZ [Streptococcaceae bacterium]